MMLRPNEPLIGDHNVHAATPPPGQKMGLVPRDFATHPPGYYRNIPQVPVDFAVIPRTEWPERIKDKVAVGSQISDVMIAKNVPCLDQNGRGYCWGHSTTGVVQALRALQNEPTVGLSAYAVCCIIKSYADEGGWGAESADFIAERGVPSEQFWPQRSVSRSNDKPEMWANALLHRITEGWWDIAVDQYDRTLSFDQECTLYLSDTPVVKDENWWSHSIMGCDVVDGASHRQVTRGDSGKLLSFAEFEFAWGMKTLTGGFGVRIRNSWGDSYGDRGFATLTGTKAVSDGAVAPRVVTASAA